MTMYNQKVDRRQACSSPKSWQTLAKTDLSNTWEGAEDAFAWNLSVPAWSNKNVKSNLIDDIGNDGDDDLSHPSPKLHMLINLFVDHESFVNLHQLIQTLCTSEHVFVSMEEGI